MKKNAEKILNNHAIRITADRLLVLETLMNKGRDFSLADIEAELDTVDRSTIYRTLELFVKADIIHGIDDGSGYKKYYVCTCHNGEHHFNHVHFVCTNCQKTFCLQDVPLPSLNLPEGFEVGQMTTIVKGICPNCRAI